MNTSTKIDAHLIPADARLGTLPRHFGRQMQLVEGCIYDFMSSFSNEYQDGWWEFYELSNGGFYMSPPEGTYELRIDSNGFAGRMSAQAAGITVCLFAFSHLSFDYPIQPFTQHFHWLRDFAADHADARMIFAAID